MAISCLELEAFRQPADRGPVHGEGLFISVQACGRKRHQTSDGGVRRVGQKWVILPQPAGHHQPHDMHMLAQIKCTGEMGVMSLVVGIQAHLAVRRHGRDGAVNGRRRWRATVPRRNDLHGNVGRGERCVEEQRTDVVLEE